MELNWPLASLIFCIFFIIFYRKEISALFSSIRGIGRNGLSFEPSVSTQRDDKKSRFDELSNVGNYELVKMAESKIIDELQKDGLFHDSDTVRILLKHLALTQMQLEFERIYQVIFGSQILLLKRLNEKLGIGLRRGYVEKFTSEIIEKNDDLQDWDVDEYLNFLLSKELIREDDGIYQITIKGRDFLSYLIAAGFKEDKYL